MQLKEVMLNEGNVRGYIDNSISPGLLLNSE